MFQAICTKYIGPSAVKGSRVKAMAEAGSITLHWDDSLNSHGNHLQAARALARKYGWKGQWYGGGTKDGCCFVCVDATAGFVTEEAAP